MNCGKTGSGEPRGMKLIFSAILLLICSPAVAQITDWNPQKELADPKDSSITINIAGNPHYGFEKGWVSSGKKSDGFVDATATEIYFRKDGYWGRLVVSEFLGRGSFDETTATKAVKRFAYWRDRIVDPSNNGSFEFRGATLRWIAFPHKTPQGKDAQCGALMSSGRGSKLALRAYWCMEGGRPMTEADVSAFVRAVGYKDHFSPQPMGAPPGR